MPIKVGDIVEIDGFRGIVSNIGIRTTSITDTGDNVKIINNSAMKNILNRSDKLSRSVSDICRTSRSAYGLCLNHSFQN